MSDMGDLLFRHFEKILAALFSLALLYSIVFYGPWIYGTDYDAQLGEVADNLAAQPEIKAADVPEVPNYEATYREAGTAGSRGRLPKPHVWNIVDRPEGHQTFPPADVEAQSNRGFIEIAWDYNTNQENLQGLVEFVGIEVARAAVIDGVVGPFETVTKSGGRNYLLPQEIYRNNVEYAPLVDRAKQRKRQQTAAAGAHTMSDLWNAVADGRLPIQQVGSIVSQGVRRGEFTSEDLYGVREFMRELRFAIPDERRNAWHTDGKRITAAEALRRILAVIGYRGGGNYRRAGLVVGPSSPEEERIKPRERVVRWGEMVSFFDSDVNPDLEYRYKARFWANKVAELPGEPIQTEWAEAPGAVSPKPDTEFSLTGGYVDAGMPWITVRKWLPIANKWESRNYRVTPGEEIGRKEVLQQFDAQGRVVRDAGGNAKTQTVDFSTQCVLLAFREQSRPGGQINPGIGLHVDNSESPMYLMFRQLQIVYSDRRGDLRVKWQASAGAS